MFDLIDSIESIPVLVHGKVVKSNFLNECKEGKVNCKHQFKINVFENIKGKSPQDTLTFEYEYFPRLPGIDLFKENFEYIFAITKITKKGHAELYGISCGKSGAILEDKSKIKAAIQRLEKPKSD